MNQVQTVTATNARNNFFELLDESYLQDKPFLVKKRNIPMVYVIPVTAASRGRKSQPSTLVERAEKLRASMNKTSDSVKLLREIRRNGK